MELMGVSFCFAIVFGGYEQHAIATGSFFAGFFVVRFVAFAQGDEPGARYISKELEALVDEPVVHQYIADAVERDANAEVELIVEAVHDPEHDEQPGGYGEYEGEEVVLFEMFIVRAVMIFVQTPQEAVHHVSMQQPGNRFHASECQKDQAYVPEIDHLTMQKKKNYQALANKICGQPALRAVWRVAGLVM
jgi:hypothetical protein